MSVVVSGVLCRFKLAFPTIIPATTTTLFFNNNFIFHPKIYKKEEFIIIVQTMIGALAARNNLRVKNASQLEVEVNFTSLVHEKIVCFLSRRELGMPALRLAMEAK